MLYFRWFHNKAINTITDNTYMENRQVKNALLYQDAENADILTPSCFISPARHLVLMTEDCI